MPRLIFILLLAGCAATTPATESRETAGLAQELQGRVGGEPTSCVSVMSSERLTVVDRRTLVLRSGRTLWVNQLQADCPGLDPLNTLIVEAQGSRYCRGDHVRGLAPGSAIAGPICPLGDFVPYRRPS